MTELLSSRILIVDDEPVNITLLRQLLDDQYYTNLFSTTDPRQVLPMYMAEPFDLILLDIRMPHMSGLDVLTELRQAVGNDWLPVLVLTAQTDDDTRLAALEAGARDFINKPFKNWEVLLRIRNLLETSQLTKRQKNRAVELEEQVLKRTRDLERTQLAVIERLGRAGEYRDNETGTHVTRMSRSCRLLALAAGLSPTHAENILLASTMHDVGKIGIPDHILLKRGPLTSAERKAVETHSEIGADIIGEHQSGILSLARLIALTHHEKWDGTGYPFGLKGEGIPIEARIAAICDVFDALTSPRPYKNPWTVEEAITLIVDQAGKHFDPAMVDAFRGILPEITILRSKFPDPE